MLSAFAAIGMAIPTFVIGIALIIAIGVELDMLPTQGYVSFQRDPLNSVKSTLLPAFTLGIGVAAVTMRILRASLVEIGSSSVRPDRAREGPAALPGRRPARAPERLHPRHHRGRHHRRPSRRRRGHRRVRLRAAGLGTLLVDSVFQRDYAVLQTLVLMAAAAFIVTSLLVDVLLGFVDPRLRVEAVS